MMRQNENPLNKEYLKTKVMTASPEQLQLMLYDGAIRFCEQARAAIENKEIEKSFNLIMRSEKIVLELQNSMKDDIAPEICANMRRLYTFCYTRLVDANMKKDIPSLDEALGVLRHMRETWLLLMERIQAERAGEPIEIPKSIPIPPPSNSRSAGQPAELQLGSLINFQG